MLHWVTMQTYSKPSVIKFLPREIDENIIPLVIIFIAPHCIKNDEYNYNTYNSKEIFAP